MAASPRSVFNRSFSGGSPLKDRPLRNPGQSLDEALDRIVEDKVLPYALFPMFFWAQALTEWLAKWRAMPRSPGLYAGVAAVLTVWSLWRLVRLRRVVENFKLGRDGERAVGQFLERLRASGAQVLHDVPAEGFNLDHVVISERGVYAIETKTWRKRRKDEQLWVREGQLYRDRTLVSPNPIEQARAGASWLRQLLRESTGKDFPVRGVVLFPRWFVNEDGPRGDIWVLEPKALPSFIEHELTRLESSDVHLAEYHLGRYVRAGT